MELLEQAIVSERASNRFLLSVRDVPTYSTQRLPEFRELEKNLEKNSLKKIVIEIETSGGSIIYEMFKNKFM